MTKCEFVYRPVRIVSLGEVVNLNEKKLEEIIVEIEGRRTLPLDVGSLVYSARQYKKTSNNTPAGQTYKVKLKTLLPHRKKMLLSALDHISTSGFSPNTQTSFIGCLRAGLAFVENIGLEKTFLKTIEDTRADYSEMMAELRHQVRTQQTTPRSAQNVQSNLGKCIWMAFGEAEYLYVSRNNTNFKGKLKSTKPREIEELLIVKKTYQDLAYQLTEFLIEGRSFPFKIKMPNFETYIFPYRAHYHTPYLQSNTLAYMSEAGRLKTYDEYKNAAPNLRKNEINSNLKNAQENLLAANKNLRDKSRRSLANIALQSYQMLFMIVTGAYESEIAQLRWTGPLDVKKSAQHKEFKIVKLRASGKIIPYLIASGSVAIFKKYLELRSWVLNGKIHDSFFITLTAKSWNAGSIRTGGLRGFQQNNILGKFLSSDFGPLTARQCRKTKNIFLHEDDDVPVGVPAQLLGHDIPTNENNYMDVSPENAKRQFGNFWDSAHEAILHIRAKGAGDSEAARKIATGHCDDYSHPEAAIDSAPVPPDCKSQYGCLFCKHFICHADDTDDVHKLTSLLFIVDGVINAASEEKKALEKFELLAARVREILHAIMIKSDTGKRNVKAIAKKVFEDGELTPYWEIRLQRYERLGLILK